MESPEHTSASLLERVRVRDGEAWQRLVRLYGPLICCWCRRWGIAADDLGDVVQEVFLAVAGSLDAFERRGAGAFRGWVRGIARHKALDHQRRRNRQLAEAVGGSTAHGRIQAIPEADFEADDLEDGEEVAGLYHRALETIRDSFEDKTWQAFWRTAVDGRASDVVAAELGMTAVAVRVAKSRVLARLRHEMDGLVD
jgi:RNA polymerase sigma-70 factor (ECF subfamily)